MFEEKIKELGFELPEAPKPLASYVPVIKSGNIVYTAGQLPLVKGEIKFPGKLGKEVSDADGKKAAEYSCLNCLSVIKSAAGSLENIKQILKVTVFVNCTAEYTNQPEIANGASDLLVKVFGEKGKHARSAVGVNQLPKGAPVEIEIIAEVE
ncbi:MAG: RidA family protein [Bacteroidota bacterium]|nr:RidA family protein [Bacteroidota bacterium]